MDLCGRESEEAQLARGSPAGNSWPAGQATEKYAGKSLMERRFLLFVVLSIAILMGYSALLRKFGPQRPGAGPAAQPGQQAPKLAGGEQAAGPEPEEGRPPEGAQAGQPGQPGAAAQPGGASGSASAEQMAEAPGEGPAGAGHGEAGAPGGEAAPPEAPPEPQLPEKWISLGSVDPADPYRMLVTLSTRGAAVARIELSSPRFRDLDDRSGYLGHLVIDPAAEGPGCKVDVVGRGTPAHKAGLKPGDLIRAVDGQEVTGWTTLRKVLDRKDPGQVVHLKVLRDGAELQLPVTLARRPLEVVRPEGHDPLSFRMTLAKLDNAELKPSTDTVQVGEELKGVRLWEANWELVSADEQAAVFRRVLPAAGLEIVKRYRLQRVPEEHIEQAAFPAYHLVLQIEILNRDEKPHEVAYQLDGPTGLPTEGYWYANKVSRSWGGGGLRDMVVSFDGRTPAMVNCRAIARADVEKPYRDEPLTYIGVDAQYFSVILLPQKKDPAEIWLALSHPLRVGPVPERRPDLTNTSCRLISKAHKLAPDERLVQRYLVFAGPKKPKLLAAYGLDEVVYYGWPIFAWFAVPLVHILHIFYALVHNYGLAIVLLTVLVRGCMFPLGRKMALNAQKMQELQPEIRRIQQKYKNDLQARTKAQQELFRKHNYNPLGGCLVMFIQLPIFIALYRALMVDVELRQAPLLTEAIRWCSNLAAPDMLYDWSWLMPAAVTSGQGIFGLGPYFNLLPVLTVAIFIWQQKMFMPPPADEQAAMQQKVMQWMMLFMGVLFFKVASGLCLYFIASSLWGVAERKLLPKPTAPDDSAPAVRTRAEAKAEAKAAKSDSAAETRPLLQRLFKGAGSRGSDGAASARKSKKSGKH